MKKDWINKQYQENITPEDKLRNLNFCFNEKSVIDLGCNIGLVADYVLKRGAKSYLGLDNNPEYQKHWEDKKGMFFLDDLKESRTFVADIIIAIGIFHHLTDKELWDVVCKIKADTVIIEAPTQGQSKNYNIRSVEQYQDFFHNHELTQRHESGFKTPPVKREIMVFQR